MGKGKATVTRPEEDISDDEFYNDGLHEMTEEEFHRYQQQIQESQGFDVESFPNLVNTCLIQPIPMECDYDDNVLFTQFAIDHYNEIEGGYLKLVRTIKWNQQFFGPWDYDNYITFLAKDVTTGQTDTYQAMVVKRKRKEDWKVPIFRKKPNHETNKGMKKRANAATSTESNAGHIITCRAAVVGC